MRFFAPPGLIHHSAQICCETWPQDVIDRAIARFLKDSARNGPLVPQPSRTLSRIENGTEVVVANVGGTLARYCLTNALRLFRMDTEGKDA